MSSFKEYLFEKKKADYEVYHNQYSEAVTAVIDFATRNGFTLDDETDPEDIGSQVWDKISVGDPKPKDGKTNKFNLTLYKNNKEVKKHLHVQIYGMKSKYELNMYIS